MGIDLGKMVRWMKAVIANSRPYAPMAGIDVQETAKKLFPEEEEKDKKTRSKNHKEDAEKEKV